jgi:hypothetical protein
MAVLELNGEKVNVFPFSEDYAAVQDVPIASVCTVWEEPTNREIWMLVYHEALFFGHQLEELLLCPNQIRAAGVTIEDAPMQFVVSSSSHSIKVTGAPVIPLQMHGFISHFRTRLLPTSSEEIEHFHNGQFQAMIELTDDIPWELYSEEFARRESVALASRSISTTHTTSPRPKPSPQHAAEEEEKHQAEAHNASSEAEAEEDYEEPEESDNDNTFPFPRRPWDPNKEARCIAVATQWVRSREAIDMADDDTLATCLVAAMNTGSSDIDGDGLDERPQDSLFTASEEDRMIAAMSARERGSVITKEILAR